jgi:methionyl aminopeptidase
MPIIIKSRREIEMMRQTGRIGHAVLHKMAESVRAGVTTADLDRIGAEELVRFGATSMNKFYPTYKPGEGYPADICISVNEEVVHGIPGKRVLNEGDVVTLDLGLKFQDHCADTALTVAVGQLSPANSKLLSVTREALELGLRQIRPGRKWSEIARQIQQFIEGHRFSVVREFVGHGVGRTMHEEPKVANFVDAEQLRFDFKLRAGMTFALEPMVAMGRRDVKVLPDQWTVVTEDGRFACHFEHTVAVTETGVDVLTDGREPWGL